MQIVLCSKAETVEHFFSVIALRLVGALGFITFSETTMDGSG